MSSLRDLLNKSKERAAASIEAKVAHEAPLVQASGPKAQAAVPGATAIVSAEMPKTNGALSRFGAKIAAAPLSIGGKILDVVPTVVEPSRELVPAQPRGIAPPALPVQDLGNDTLEKLRENLEYLANNIEHRAQVKQVVQTIMAQIIRNPQFKSGMNNGDFDLIVRGARASYEFAARRKTEGKTAKTAKSGQAAELMQMLKDSGIDLKLEDE